MKEELRTEEIVYARPPVRPPTHLNLITSFFPSENMVNYGEHAF
jgi:hypothetical protein